MLELGDITILLFIVILSVTIINIIVYCQHDIAINTVIIIRFIAQKHVHQ